MHARTLDFDRQRCMFARVNATLIKIPESATEPNETVAASSDDVKAILAHRNTKGMTLERAAVALIAYTSVRPGECRGVLWEEWDRTASQIEIVRSVWHAVEGTIKMK